MENKLAFVLGGGGSRGAMQVGALRALFEAGYYPDLVTGTSIGAANGAFLAVHGFTQQGISKLEQVWKSTVDQDLLPTNLWWQTMQTFFKQTKGFSQQRIREFAIANGLLPDLRFKDLPIKFFPVAADLNAGCPVIFGLDAEEFVLESVLASMSLPPWITPEEKNGRLLMDGGAVSNLPVEAALRQGATEIIALDLSDPSDGEDLKPGLRNFFLKLDKTMEGRQTELEIELANACGVPVHRLPLIGERPVPLWDFRFSAELMEHGYQLTRQIISTWPAEDHSSRGRMWAIQDFLEGFIEALK